MTDVRRRQLPRKSNTGSSFLTVMKYMQKYAEIEDIQRQRKGRLSVMSLLGNILWFLCGGIVSGFSWLILGILWCITIVGIPIGRQCFKIAGVAFFPFGKE